MYKTRVNAFSEKTESIFSFGTNIIYQKKREIAAKIQNTPPWVCPRHCVDVAPAARKGAIMLSNVSCGVIKVA